MQVGFGSRWCPRQDSNLRPCLRRAVLYPLSYGGSSCVGQGRSYQPPTARPDGGRQGAGSGVPPRAVSIAVSVCTSAAWVSAMVLASSRTAGTDAWAAP